MSWLKKYAYEVHLLAFALMVLSSIGMYYSAWAGSVPLTILFIGLFALANFLVLAAP
jgi:hypothetical protein